MDDGWTCFLVLMTILYIPTIILTPIVEMIVMQNTITFLTFTYWMLFFQGLYYIFELVVHVYKIENMDKTRYIILNIIFAPSVVVLCYWILLIEFDWNLPIPWFIDISIHGLNIFALVFLVLLKFPYIGFVDTVVLNYILPFVIGIVYAICVVIYTSTSKKLIYDTNLFSFEVIENKAPYGWLGILVFVIPTVVTQFLFYVLCSHIRKGYTTVPYSDV